MSKNQRSRPYLPYITVSSYKILRKVMQRNALHADTSAGHDIRISMHTMHAMFVSISYQATCGLISTTLLKENALRVNIHKKKREITAKMRVREIFQREQALPLEYASVT